MLKSIKYSVTFPDDGQTYSGDYTFTEGVTVVTGRNGTGKSFLLEMYRYLLFGSEALRGEAADYKTLKVEGVVAIAGRDYTVRRSAKEELVLDGTAPLASGTTAVNAKLKKLLGFGLKVFDIACACTQGEIEALTKMRATERKKMVDSVVGLTAIEALEKWTATEATNLRREARAIEEGLVAPAAPVEPAGYRPAAELKPALADTEQRIKRFYTLKGIAAPTVPVPPVDPGVDAYVVNHEADRAEVERRRQQLLAELRAYPEPEYSAADAEASQRYHDYVRAKAHWERDHVECPACHLQFVPDQSADRVPPLPVALPPVLVPEGKIAAALRAAEGVAQRQALLAELDALPVLTDRSAELRARQAYEQELVLYERRLADAEVAAELHRAAQAELATLGDVEGEVAELRASYHAAVAYEAALASYQVQAQAYNEALARIAERETRADGFGKATKALKRSRQKVKSYLIPSLERAASAYLATMTNGERTTIQIDEDFELTVDGKAVHKLEGSGKAIANLAVRIGLGQVLTHRVFPVFLGDEVDAALDKFRAEGTVDTLKGLSERIKQVMLVTHKDLAADTVIALG